MRKIKITHEQYNRLFQNNSLNESTNVRGGLNRVNKSFSANLSGKDVQNLSEEPFNIKAPVPGVPNSTMKRKSERKLNENDSHGSTQAIFDFIKHIWEQSNGQVSSPFFEGLGLSWEQVADFLVSKEILDKTGEQEYRVKNFFKRKYSKDLEAAKVEKLKDIADVSKKLADDPEAPWSKHGVMGEIAGEAAMSNNQFKPVGLGKELAVLMGPDGYYIFDYDNERRSHYPNPELVLNADDIAEYVNANIDSIPKGEGLDGWNKEALLIKVDEALKNELNMLFAKDRQFLKALNSIKEMTGAASSGAFVAPLGTETVKRELEETTNTAPSAPNSSSTGAYVQPAIWAKDKKNWKGDKKTQYPNGELVSFDDCTKLNNNKATQNGKCSTGAADSVVKTKKTKGSVISKSMYEQIAEKTGRTVEDVKRIIETKLKKGSL
jgi:hypothetical protein